MTRATFVLLSAVALSSPASGGASKPARQLFNGKDLAGWEHVGPGEFVVENGLLKTKGAEGLGLLWYTKEKFGNCTLKVVWKTPTPADNSGVFVRVADKPSDAWFAVHHGYEVQILDGDKDQYHRTGAVYSLSAAVARASKPPGAWNEYRITLEGLRIVVELNGVLVSDFQSDQASVPERKIKYEPEREPKRPPVGYIGLQNHFTSTAYFKEISISEIDPVSERSGPR